MTHPSSFPAAKARIRRTRIDRSLGLILAIVTLAGCSGTSGPNSISREAWSANADANGHSAPTAFTIAANRRVAATLPLDDRQDFEDALRGHVASEDELIIQTDDGTTIWDTRSWAFLGSEFGKMPPPSPDSVNPSLWRQAHLNAIHGLFRVTDGIHQVRGYDLANMTLIDGKRGWIVVDPLTNKDSAAAALALARKHLGDRPISAIVITHSHIDHFGGIHGIVSNEEVREQGIRIIAPEGFLHEATSENIIAGPVMIRRAGYMYGFALGRDARGHVDTGLGRQPGTGDSGLMEPSEIVDHTPQEMTIDGVRFVFQNAPDSEAPAELTFYLPEKRAFCGAEIVSHTMHNLYTLRGAKVRDALRWSGYIDEAMRLFPDAEVAFASHHWPVWGGERVRTYLEGQRDLYKFIHDQTLRMAGAGKTPGEIAEEIALPESIDGSFANRGYYGTAKHNSRAVYQGYFGWFDGNPANLDPLPPEQHAARTIEWMGGAASVLERAQGSFDRGEYRWVASVLAQLVFAEPDDEAARELLARSYDQLGYQAESGPWRDVYLSGAYELRNGVALTNAANAAAGMLASVPLPRFFDAIATRIDPVAAAKAEDLRVNFEFVDRGENILVEIENAVLHHRSVDATGARAADANIRLTHSFFIRLITGQVVMTETLSSDEFALRGSRLKALQFFRLITPADDGFAIVTP